MSLVLAIVNAWRPCLSHLQEVEDFGTNPGALRMLTYLPDNLSPRPALVVVLHGSMQSATDYDLGAGWSTLADRYGFALLMPEQSRRNNLSRSFNWFQRNDTQRGEGEAHSIAQMVEQMVHDHDIDRRRIFVTGLSAGGAMTLAMLATYPDVFAAGAVIAGLPYGGATNAQEALRGMFQAPPRSSRELGDLVREASPNSNIWPKLSVWHGSADRTVKPSNAGEIIKQWLDVHELPLTPMSDQIVDGHSRQVWWNVDGETVVESYTIADMAHGTPLTHSEGAVAGPYMIEAGISSSAHIAEFFGLTDTLRRTPAETTKLSRPAPVFGALRKATRSHRIRAVRAWRNVSATIHEGIARRRANKEIHVRFRCEALIISRLPVLKAFWPRRGDDKEKHGADFSGSVVAFGKVRNALSLERNLAHIAGCSSVPTSDVATEVST